MKTKEEIKEQIEDFENKHIIFCGYKASECGCCASIIDNWKEDLEENKK